jgi:hypothetical protein
MVVHHGEILARVAIFVEEESCGLFSMSSAFP